MNNMVKSQKGITLIALVITIIVLLISLSELNKVQQVVIETYLKYKQLENESFLIGKKVEGTEYDEVNNALKQASENNYELMLGENGDIEKSYYLLNKGNLEKMGLENIHNNDEYVVNYYTGEVFNYSQRKSSDGVLYVYAKEIQSQ